jgi:WD40 repeat protein
MFCLVSRRQSQIIMWDVEKREVRHTFIGHTGIVMDMIVLPVLRTNPANWPRRALVSCSVDATIRVWDPQNRKELRVFRGHEKEVMCVAYSGTI